MSKPFSKVRDTFAATPAKVIGFIIAAWTTIAIVAGVAAERTGIPRAYSAWSTAAAIAPAAITALLLTWASRKWAQSFIVFVWLSFAGIGAALTGGFTSTMTIAYALAPAFARQLGGRAAAAEAAFFAALAFLIAGVASQGFAALPLGFLPACAAGLSLLSIGALVAVTAVAPPAPPMPPPKIAAAESEAARARRETAQVIAAHRRRAAELAHELRTPLTHIIGFTDAMRQRLFGPLAERYGEYADLIHASGRNMLDLVNGLLDLSRLEAGKYPLEMEMFDFHLIAEETVRLMAEAAAAKKIVVALEADETLPVCADARALRQVLSNLLGNALKFTPHGGAVTVRAGAARGMLVIEVEDTGPGIPAAERARLGGAFERGHAGAGADGYGLGLSLVRALAEAHGGELSFHAAPGGGALVRVSLPVLTD